MPIQPVILAGGFGTRLWPLSREDYPKQFNAFVNQYSLLQNTLQRLQNIDNQLPPIVICNEIHRFIVAEQLQTIKTQPQSIILEPCSRNTAPAIALAALSAKPDTILLVLPADHVIRNHLVFSQVIQQGLAYARQKKLLTFGIVPRIPHTGYGYIHRGGRLPDGGFQVANFVEKPSIEIAEKYIAAGDYYWNSGMFMFRADSYLEALAVHQPEVLSACKLALASGNHNADFTRINAHEFAKSPAISIDYAVMEKTKDAIVLPLEAGWSDVGSWTSIWEVGPQDDSGNVLHGDVFAEHVTNSYLRAESRLLAVVGVDDHVVIESPDAVLVAHRNSTEQIKKIVTRLAKENRTERFYEQIHYQAWGQWRHLVQDSGFIIRKIKINPNALVSLQDLNMPIGQWLILQGSAELETEHKKITLTKGESCHLSASIHSVKNLNNEALVILETQFR